MSGTPFPIVEREDQSDHGCPSCGRYVGPYDACPYCGARLSGRTPIRTVKIAAIALATLGMGGLWLVAARSEVPTIPIGRACATMNLAYVRVEGRCTRVPSYDAATDTLGFWVSDETGDLYVTSYRSETRGLIDQGNVPALGDRVSVAGTLRIREDFRSLTIDVPDQLAITRADPVERAIGAIVSKDVYQRVRVRGQVRRLVEPYPGLTLVTLRDETGAVDLAVSDELIALSGAVPLVAVGQSVEVTASVSLYGATPQLVPASASDILPLNQEVPVAASRFIVELNDAQLARWVALRGTVTRVDPFSEGVKLTLDDGTGVITVLLWNAVADSLGTYADLAPGAEVWAQGQLSQYAGELEVIPETASDVQVVSPSPAPVTMSIRDLTGDRVGQLITLVGTLGEPRGFSRGVKFPLTDDTGTVILLLWQEVFEALPQAAHLVSGARVEVTGQLDQYQGELEIIPEVDGVQVMEQE